MHASYILRHPLTKYEKKIRGVLKGSASLQAPNYLIILGKYSPFIYAKHNKKYQLMDFILSLREKLI